MKAQRIAMYLRAMPVLFDQDRLLLNIAADHIEAVDIMLTTLQAEMDQLGAALRDIAL